MGKKKRNQNDEKQDKVNVSINKNEDSACNNAISNVHSDKRTKSKKHKYSNNEMQDIPVNNKKAKNYEVTLIALENNSNSELNNKASKKVSTKKQDKWQVQEVHKEKSNDTIKNKNTRKNHSQYLVQDVLAKEEEKEDSPCKTQFNSVQIIKKSKEKQRNTVQNEQINDYDLEHKTSNDLCKKAKKKNIKINENTQQEINSNNCKNDKKKRKQNIEKDIDVDKVVKNKDPREDSNDFSKKPRKKNIEVVLDDGEDSEVKTNSVNNRTGKKKRKQNMEDNVDPHEETNIDNDSKKTKKKRKRKIVEEEVLNDEDIDRYCDELDAAHNKQYEDWVKVIEATLKSNKKDKK